MLAISTVIITHNEEEQLERCVRSCLPFSDEVLVVDSHSTDATRALAQSLGCRVIENQWPGYSAQRNFGAARASHDWVFSIDADEHTDVDLQEAISTLRRSAAPVGTAFSIHRVNSFMGAWLMESPESIVRLYDRRLTGYREAIVHEVVDVPVGKTQTLPGRVWHETHTDLEDATRRLDLYTSLEAEREARRRDMRPWRLFLRPMLRFGHRYVLQRAFRHGWRGLFFAFHWTYWELLREMKIYEHRRFGRNRDSPG